MVLRHNLFTVIKSSDIAVVVLSQLCHRSSVLLGRAQPVIPPNLYNVNEHNSLGSPGKLLQAQEL